MSTPGQVAGIRIETAAAVLDRVRREWRRGFFAGRLVSVFALCIGLAAGLILTDQIFSLPAAYRDLLRWLPAVALFVLAVRAVLRAFPGPAAHRLALLAEEHRPDLQHQLSTALSVTASGPVARAFLERASAHLAALPGSLIRTDIRVSLVALAATSGALLVLLAMVPGGTTEVASRWLRPADDPATGLDVPPATVVGRTAEEAALEIRNLSITVQPPSYTGEPSRSSPADAPIRALAGSTLVIAGVAPRDAHIAARVLGADDVRVRRDEDRFRIQRAVTESDRGIEIVASTEDGAIAHRVLPLMVAPDADPTVELWEPAADLTLATPTGRVAFRATARDDYGVGDFQLGWILSRGSGESFSFIDGGTTWDREEAKDGVRTGTFELDVAALGLQPGDVLHVRAIARDRNAVTGPGEGVSRTRLIRIAHEGDRSEVNTLIGFPIEAEKDPILSQRMIVLLTERLIERSTSLPRDSVRAQSEEIARQQTRLRERLADIIYARTTGEEDGEHGAAVDMPLALQEGTTAVDRERRMEALLEAASRATGQGTLEELTHQHDPDPALAVAIPLLPAFNAMYEAERWLRQADPRKALPHARRALEVIQQVREAERVFLRGHQTVAPVDIAAARTTGDPDDAEPAARTGERTTRTDLEHIEALSGIAAQLGSMSARDAALALSALSARLLDDRTVDARAGALLASAAAAARSGDVAEARSVTAAARRILAPPSGAAAVSLQSGPRSATAAEYLDRVATGDTAVGRVATPGGDAPPFVLATARYASGDWDSGQLVPANLIHSLALYTDMPLEPEGVVVDLDSPDLFRYPFVFLTGHLPVRFTAAEASNLHAYVERGGFLFIDDHNHDIDGAFHRTVTAELERIFGTDSLEQLPTEHELYSAFFRFEDGPPTTSHELNGWGDGLIHEHLFAVRAPDNRIGVLYSNKDYTSEWSYHVQNKRFLAEDNTRFGVNVILYALTR